MGGSVTAEQRDVFLEAFRNTFNAEDHGKALKNLYEHFSERFVVDADVLRGVVREDLAENPKLYAKLRNELAAQQEPVKPRPKVKKSPGIMTAKKPRSTSDLGTEPKKKQKKVEKTPRKVVTQNRRTGRGPEMECRICGQKVRINRNGTMAVHNAQGRIGLVPCPGAGIKVAPPKTDDKRQDDRSDSSSIRTVTSGLGSLGKR